MITITGATGSLNRATVDHLLQSLDPSELVVVVRDPSRADGLARRGVEVRAGDYADPHGLRAAFEGADRLLLVSSNDQNADAAALHRGAIQAASDGGRARALHESSGGRRQLAVRPRAGSRGDRGGARRQRPPWTALRNGFYAHSLQWLLGPWRKTGAVSVPADGPVSWTSRDDLAEAAARLLGRQVLPQGPVTLTATHAPSFADLARWAGETAGREVALDVIDEEEWMQRSLAAGRPEGAVRFTLGVFQAAEGGFFAGTDPALRTLLGREPVTARSVVDSLARA